VRDEVVIAQGVDLNILMDTSSTSMPYSVWREDFDLPVALLLRLRTMAIQWRSGFTGLPEEDKETCRDLQQKENKRKQRDKERREAAERQSSER
jgi:hypothetical protein